MDDVAKQLLGNLKGPKGDPGPAEVSKETNVVGFEEGEFLFNNDGKLGGRNILDILHPIGSIFEWSNNGVIGAPDLSTAEKMEKYFGGTWREFGKGQVLVGLDTSQTEFATIGKTGGEKTHQLTEAELARHSHKVRYVGKDANGANGGQPGTSTDAEPAINQLLVDYAGGDQPHNNLQPYVVIYRWQRIA